MAEVCSVKKSPLEISRAIDAAYSRLERTNPKSTMYQFQLGELACLLWLVGKHPFDVDQNLMQDHVYKRSSAKTAGKPFLVKGSKPCQKLPVA